MMRFIQLIKKILFIVLFFPCISWGNPSDAIVIDAVNVERLPKNFRSTRFLLNKLHRKSLQGLDSLNMLGSGQFSEAMLLAVLKTLPKKNILIDIDLRKETHGFINGNAVSIYGRHNWANEGKSNDQIEKEENHFLKQLKKTKFDKIYSEADLVKKYHIKYKRIYVTDHCRPSDESVDQFVYLIKKMPKNAWIYFHCRAGAGRTTTFMSMYDMMRNAKKVSFEDILKRQQLLGGKDLLSAPEKKIKKRKIFKLACAKERAHFLHSFYHYCQSHGNYSWRDWLALQK